MAMLVITRGYTIKHCFLPLKKGRGCDPIITKVTNRLTMENHLF